jgi:hypothetical protein
LHAETQSRGTHCMVFQIKIVIPAKAGIQLLQRLEMMLRRPCDFSTPAAAGSPLARG